MDPDPQNSGALKAQNDAVEGHGRSQWDLEAQNTTLEVCRTVVSDSLNFMRSSRIRIRIDVISRIRIRTEVKRWIRIRNVVMRTPGKFLAF
jgi:hypothetical protein